ncbi:MAG TPA: Xaa-Pro peptidase family protein [Candidatus Methylomirabilis sp.]|nr:Xaa-Pro peptidase family protein [Candidatus Methylomirabilis sp.]
MDYTQYLKELTSRPIPKEMAFPESEYRRRADKVKTFMDEKGLDALLVSFIPNVCYMSGYQAFAADLYACMVLPRAGEPSLQVAELEIPGALLNGWVTDVRSVRWIDPDAVATELANLLKERGLDGKRIGVETRRSGLSIDVYERVRQALPTATLMDASDLVARARLIKSPLEIEHMRKAARITRDGIDAAVQIIRPGVTENDIASVGYQTMVKAGSEYFSSQPIVAGAHRSGWVHASFKRTPLQAGHTAILEFGAAYQRYTSAIMHSVAIGAPSPAIERLARASNEALDLLLHTVKPGRTAHDVAREITASLREISAEAYWTGMYGYSIGLGFPPTWREMISFIAEGNDQPLEPGMTFHSPISLRLPGTAGVGFSETWVLTEAGPEVLTAHDRKLTIVPA